jgi:hypothetical protein
METLLCAKEKEDPLLLVKWMMGNRVNGMIWNQRIRVIQRKNNKVLSFLNFVHDGSTIECKYSRMCRLHLLECKFTEICSSLESYYNLCSLIVFSEHSLKLWKFLFSPPCFFFTPWFPFIFQYRKNSVNVFRIFQISVLIYRNFAFIN